jgi:farnesyl-diphosphate farnesyltransferase
MMAHPTPSVAVGRRPPTAAEEAFQERSLAEVSRTFALTIPVLPPAVRRAVANGYLLCRIADTIEDDPALSSDAKREFAERFIDAVAGGSDGSALAADLAPRLAPEIPAAERELVAATEAVLRITHDLPQRQQDALARCVAIMSRGMADFQARETHAGVATLAEMDLYCYYVAGVVGEMLTEIFCDYREEIEARRKELMPLAVSFGQALQMTNIIKDVWEDRRRGVCWFPREIFAPHGCDLAAPDLDVQRAGFARGLEDLIAIARGHLRNALRYVELLPADETGIRRFCLWALGMAVMTLRRVQLNPGFKAGQEVKISRRTVGLTVATLNLLTGSNTLLRLLFYLTTWGLPSLRYRDNILAASKL